MARLLRSSFLFSLGLTAASSLGQGVLNSPVGTELAYTLDSGAVANDTNAFAPVFGQVITVDKAAWLCLKFSGCDLPGSSYLVITSVLDGEQQRLDAAAVKMWSSSTAYFNGDSVVLQLFAAPHTRNNRVAIERLTAEFGRDPAADGAPGQCGICGGSDDRTPSAEDWSCRLMTVGCTASVFCEDSTLISAGHCVSGTLVAQFRVPASLSTCATVNPPVADQFPVTSTQAVNAGVGNDWSVLVVGTNSLGQRPYERYGALKRIARVPANISNPASMFGYGLDLTCIRSQTQQFATGPITNRTASYYEFSTDLRGGNSGSGLIFNDQIIAVVTHCSTNCPNYGTRVDLPAFAAARITASVCDGTCYANCDNSTVPPLLNPLDFACFLNAYAAGDPLANCDSSTTPPVLNPLDFACFINAFASGCP